MLISSEETVENNHVLLEILILFNKIISYWKKKKESELMDN